MDDRIFRGNERQLLNGYQPLEHTLTLEFTGTEGRHGWPEIEVYHNTVLVYCGIVKQQYTLAINVRADQIRNLFKVKMINKQPDDTVVDELGNITKDKSVVIESATIDNCFIRNFYKLSKVFTTDQVHPGCQIFLPNDIIKFYYKNPPLEYLIKRKPVGFFDTKEVKTEVNKLFEKTTKLLFHN